MSLLYTAMGSPRFWRPRWARKGGPLLTLGRLAHLAVGIIIATSGWHWLGDEGIALGVLAGALAGWAWERATWYLAPIAHWPHPFGDLADALSFTAGGMLVGCVALLL